MNIKSFFFCILSAVVPVFGGESQRSQLFVLAVQKQVPKEINKQPHSEVVVLPRFDVIEPILTISEYRMLQSLEKRFGKTKQTPEIKLIDDGLPPIRDFSDSRIIEFSLQVRELKKLKNGFEIRTFSGFANTTFYVKSGISWHPPGNKNITYTIGPKITRKYRFKNGHDLLRNGIQAPIENFVNFLEKPFILFQGSD